MQRTREHTVAKGLLEGGYAFFQVVRSGIRCAVVRDGVGQGRRTNTREPTSVAIDVYDAGAHPAGHGYGRKDRDQSRDWCAFAANGTGLDQTVPAVSEEPVLERDGI